MTVYVEAATDREGTCWYCHGILAAGQERRLIWVADPTDPDDLVSAHAHIRCPV